MMRTCFFHFLLVLIGFFLLTGCRTGEKVISNMETTTEVKLREIPVIIPERKASVAGFIKIDGDGKFSLSHIKMSNDKGVDVDVNVSPDGQLNVVFVSHEDTTKVAAKDSITTIVSQDETTKEVKPSFIERIRSWLLGLAVMLIISILIFFFLRSKFR